MKKVMLVKLGGSLITDKSKERSFRSRVVTRLAKEIKKYVDENPEVCLILGNGGGSFPHFPAHKYQTHKGFGAHPESHTGFCLVHQAAAELNLLITQKLLDQGIQAFSLQTSALLKTRSNQVHSFDLSVIKALLDEKVVPVMYGDQVLDISQGCAIASTETILNYIAGELQKDGYQITGLIQTTIVAGVLDSEGKVIEKITPESFDQVKSWLSGSHGVDVTGGMLHKVAEQVEIAKSGIRTVLVNGNKPGRLYRVLKGANVEGTIIDNR